VSRKAGKNVEFEQVGGETELDRNVVEAISDPLVHMVRNSIDHGLENPEDREKAGKSRAGNLTLKASHQAGNVVIEISDDGRGLPKEKIVKKAIAAGLVKEGQELTDQEIFQLIFAPGLSTAEKITDISGRGVGMDVVKKNVEALRGRIEIASTPGKGSVFTVRLPLTLAVIDGLIVMVGKQRYIIPITSIEQSIRPTRQQLSTIGGKGEMCMVREKLLPIVRLHELFNVEPTTHDPAGALVVIVQEGHNRSCLLVDEVVEQQQVVIKSVGKEIGSLPGIAGCAILGDGNVSLILDVAGIIHSV
jgi:two-component system chemotaxis sensor kinase CheA